MDESSTKNFLEENSIYLYLYISIYLVLQQARNILTIGSTEFKASDFKVSNGTDQRIFESPFIFHLCQELQKELERKLRLKV